MKKLIAGAIIGAFALGTFVGFGGMSLVQDGSGSEAAVVKIERDFAGYEARSNEVAESLSRIDPVVAEDKAILSLGVPNVSQFRTYTTDPVVAEHGKDSGLSTEDIGESPKYVKIDPVVAEGNASLSLGIRNTAGFRTYTADPAVAESREGFGLGAGDINGPPRNIEVDPAELTNGEGLRLHVRDTAKFRSHTTDPVMAEQGNSLSLNIPKATQFRGYATDPAMAENMEGINAAGNDYISYPPF